MIVACGALIFKERMLDDRHFNSHGYIIEQKCWNTYIIYEWIWNSKRKYNKYKKKIAFSAFSTGKRAKIDNLSTKPRKQSKVSLFLSSSSFLPMISFHSFHQLRKFCWSSLSIEKKTYSRTVEYIYDDSDIVRYTNYFFDGTDGTLHLEWET